MGNNIHRFKIKP